MLIRILSLFYLFPFFLNADVSADMPNPYQTYVMVFHQAYCEKYNNAIQHYMRSVESNGYFAFYFCTDTVDIKELKKRVFLRAIDNEVSMSEIKGINIFGPVTSSATIDYLKPNSLSIYPTSTLMLDNINLFLSRDTVIDIYTASYKAPHIRRWVSHMFTSPNEINTDISETLYAFAGKLARQGSISIGDNFKNNLRKDLSDARTIKYYSFPEGEGTALLGITSFPVLWTITGLSRMREGYSFWKRNQTPGDRFFSPILIFGMALLEGIAILEYKYTQYYLPDDNQWKKVLLRKSLNVDGLLDPNTEYVNHF